MKKLYEWFAGMTTVQRITSFLGICMSIFAIIVCSGYVLFDLWMYKCVMLIGVFLIGLLPHILDSGKSVISRIVAAAALVCGIAPCVYVMMNIRRLQMFYGSVWNKSDIIFGTMFIFAVLELTRRCFGWVMPGIGIFFLCYVLFGDKLPASFFGHTGFSFERTVSYMFSPAGIYGEIMTVFVRVVYIYLLFGAFLEYSGATDFFIKLACSVAGRWRGGPAKVAVISSALLGTINGNAVANVATTGSVTIPLMKKTGYEPHFAGAVEAVASTGGQFLPPIMGAGAFIMAEFLSISYNEVVMAAVIPALLYFASVFMTVDLEAVRLGLKGMNPDEIPDFKETMKEGGHLLIPLVVLVYTLIITRMSVTRAGLLACLLIIVLSWFRKNTRMGITEICKALAEAAKSSIGIAAVIATAGLIVGTVGITGLGVRFSSVILAIANGNFYLVAILTALICIVLGMGLPTTAAYVIAVAVASSTMINIGVPALAAHMFVFYFACISTITPPVAASSYTAATIAQSPVMKTGLYATMLGIAGYIVPFIFISSQELLMKGSVGGILLAVVTALIGLYAVANAAEGVGFQSGIKWTVFERVLLVSSALFLIVPGVMSDLIGIGIIAAAILLMKVRSKSK